MPVQEGFYGFLWLRRDGRSIFPAPFRLPCINRSFLRKLAAEGVFFMGNGGRHSGARGRLLVTGALAGLANGFFGAGGGLFLVPLLTGWAGLEQRRAFATSVAIILPLSVVSVVIYLQKGDISVVRNLPYLIGGALGGVIAGKIFGKINMLWLRRVFGVLILYGGIRALLLL